MVKQKSDGIGPSDKVTASINSQAVRNLADLLNETGLTEIEYEAHGCRIRVGKMATIAAGHSISAPHSPAPVNHSAPTESPLTDFAAHPGAITAPMVGTAYLCPKPDTPPFVKVGDSIQKDDTLMIIEAMKVMNPIRAPKAGTVSKILIENAVPVEYGQPLFVIE